MCRSALHSKVLNAGLGVLLTASAGAWAVEGPAKPQETGLTEKVEVRLVTLDVLVLDADDRTISGLTAADFELLVDGKAVPVDTLDESCAEGGLDEPKAVRHPADRAPRVAGTAPRRIAWVLDYLHLGRFARESTLAQLTPLARGRALDGDEIMVAALTGGLRVEQPFTTDHARVLQTLERMERDITLWNGNFEHVTEDGLFAGLGALCDVLASVEGPKAVVLFSEWQQPPPPQGLRFYEPRFRQLSALASDARVTIYPMEAAGLEEPQFG